MGMVETVPGSDLLVVSNRGPKSFKLDDSGQPVVAGSAGGLAGSLQGIFQGTGATWVAAALSEADRAASREGLVSDDGIDVVMVEPDESAYQMAYDVVSNATLWFAHHHLFDSPRRPKIDHRWTEAWDAYREVNTVFSTAVAEAAAEGATVLVQDYHLSLVPHVLSGMRSDLSIVHFSHTPFADPSVLRVLPTHAAVELLEGMAASVACGFHTRRWAEAFGACCASFGVEAPSTFASALAPDAQQLAERAATDGIAAARDRLRAMAAGCKTIVKVDRVEPSKNLLRSFWALDELLTVKPEWRGRVVQLSLSYASRQELPEYQAYGTEVEVTARAINEKWGTGDWAPVILDIADDPERSLAALTMYDVLLVNPLRDGMNLVAKEGPIINENSGMLALSTEAGAYDELAGAAIELNPFDLTETANAIATALEMPEAERAVRAAELKAVSTKRKPRDWLDDQLSAASRSGRGAGGSLG